MRALRIVREHLRAMVAETNAPLVRRVEALEIAHQEQRGLLTDAREDRDAWMEAAAALRATGADDIDGARDEIVRLKGLGSKLERVTAQRDELQGLLASTMGERDAAEARAHELANQVTALQCADNVDELPIRVRWAHSSLIPVGGGEPIAELLPVNAEWCWTVWDEARNPSHGATALRSAAVEQLLHAVREERGPVDVVHEPIQARWEAGVLSSADGVTLAGIVQASPGWRWHPAYVSRPGFGTGGHEDTFDDAKCRALKAAADRWGPIEVVE